MGKLYLILIAIMVFIAVSLSGLFAPPFPKGSNLNYVPDAYKCCDTGDGADCRPLTELGTITYINNHRYALLKSNMYMHDYNKNLTTEHLNPTKVGKKGNQQTLKLTPPGKPAQYVFYNPAERRTGIHEPECNITGGKEGNRDPKNKGYDRLYGAPVRPDQAQGCYRIEDELLIYLCRNDSPGDCSRRIIDRDEVKFDVWIDLDTLASKYNNVIPDAIRNCYKPPPPQTGNKMIVFNPSPGGQPNLQLRTFKFQDEKYPVTWLSPYCKPAIYLYPERKTEINVSVFPQGEMLLTIPPYPATGWDVVAEPNGNIYHQNTRFDYLYYEAAIPDQLIQKPKEGYVMNYDERALFLTDLVTKLGLNEKETRQFVEYWVPILPKAKYYYVGIVPKSKLHEISPLLISPKPKNLIRVTLYFQPLDDKISVTPPLILPVHRDGFTAVEWGGIFKQDKDHPFSCFM